MPSVRFSFICRAVIHYVFMCRTRLMNTTLCAWPMRLHYTFGHFRMFQFIEQIVCTLYFTVKISPETLESRCLINKQKLSIINWWHFYNTGRSRSSFGSRKKIARSWGVLVQIRKGSGGKSYQKEGCSSSCNRKAGNIIDHRNRYNLRCYWKEISFRRRSWYGRWRNDCWCQNP